MNLLRRLFAPKPLTTTKRDEVAVRRVVREQDAKTQKLVTELVEAGKPVPAYFVQAKGEGRA
jgi:hypothetical protein